MSNSRRDKVLIAIAVIIFIITCIAIGLALWFNARQGGTSSSSSSIANVVSSPNVAVSSNKLPNTNAGYPMKGFINSITMTFGTAGVALTPNGNWGLSVFGANGDQIFSIQFRTGNIGNEAISQSSSGGTWSSPTILSPVPPAFNMNGVNVIVATLSGTNTWNFSINGYTLPSPFPFTSTTNQTPTLASYTATTTNSVLTDPPTAIVTFS